jgi:hypothetical protein
MTKPLGSVNEEPAQDAKTILPMQYDRRSWIGKDVRCTSADTKLWPLYKPNLTAVWTTVYAVRVSPCQSFIDGKQMCRKLNYR